MNKKALPEPSQKFMSDVRKGLTSFPKFLSSKYIYDKKGDKLFQDIMNMPEYYLTDCEFNILKKHKELLAKYFASDNGFDLIELGAGDGKKTKILLKYLAENDFDFDYLPVDISQNSLDQLEESIRQVLPTVKIKTLQGMYFSVLDQVATYNKRKKVIMVLGSNIGNLLHKKAIEFLENIRTSMGPSDLLFMGFDQKKHPQIILDAYNDKAGITSAFNKNILVRINSEMKGDFDVDNFIHWETYNPETGTAKSYLVSKIPQKVNIPALNLAVDFKKWESIHVEISQKYDDETVEWLAGEAGLKIREIFSDDNKYYKNYIFETKGD